MTDWIKVSDKLPKSGNPVLIYCNGEILRALYAHKFEMNEESWGEFDEPDINEANDVSYWPVGWYEWNQYEEMHWQIHSGVTHWMLLPEKPLTYYNKPASEIAERLK